MNRNRLLLLTLSLLIGLLATHAGAQNAERPTGSAKGATNKTKNKLKQPARPPAEIDQLKDEIHELHVMVENQQRVMAEMQIELNALRAAPPSLDAVPMPAHPSAEADTKEADNSVAATALPDSLPAGTPQPAARQPIQRRQGLVAGWDEKHAFLRSADGNFETNFMGYSQLDSRTYSSGSHPANTFVVRRARLAVEGKLYKYFDFKLEGDFADTTRTLLRDAYVNIHRIDEFQLRFGQTREPYSQEEMRPDNVQDFIERSLVNSLVPSRSPGMMAYGTLGGGGFEYQVGVFNGKGLLQSNNNGTPDQALRLRLTPMKHSDSFWLKGLTVGGAYNQGRSLKGLSVQGITESRIVFFKPESVNGKVYRSNAEITWLLGPAAFRAEYDETNQRRDNLGTGATNLPGVVSQGYMAQFTYILTGEDKPDSGPVVPKRSLFDERAGRRAGLGAWEIKVRYDSLQINDSTRNSNHADSVYFGANWFMNRFIRYSIDLGVERFGDPVRAPNPKTKNFFAVLNRIQLQL
ncbi:MAG TPA: porin [Blastocatellia bacterium]|nr:porin [Blastocatellia bacterium]